MKLNRPSRRGSMIVIALGMMVMVSMLTTNQLQTLKITMEGRHQADYARVADIAARSGIDYGYAMLKNVMESMSLIHLRFATHSWDTTSQRRIADVPPSWQEILNPQFDRLAFETVDGMVIGAAAGSDIKNWVGTDSYWLHWHNNPQTYPGEAIAGADPDPGNEIPTPIDYAYAMEGGEGEFDSLLRKPAADVNSATLFVVTTAIPPPPGFRAAALNKPHRLRECPREQVSIGGGAVTTYILYQEAAYAGSPFTHCHHLRFSQEFAENGYNLPLAITDSQLDPWIYHGENRPLDGHYGTKRWHYYDAFNVPAWTGYTAGFSIDATRGTGGSIVRGRNDFPVDETAGNGTFEDHKGMLFERLIHYKFNTANTRYPHEPGDYTQTDEALREANMEGYNVQMFSAIDLDFEPNGVSDGNFQDFYLHTNYDNLRYKVFFKLWITRDVNKNGYNSEAFTPPGTWPIVAHPGIYPEKYRDIIGSELTGTASDLHPIWVVPNDSNGGLFPDVLRTSYGRRNYLEDFMDTDGDGDTNEALGVLQWPVPMLAMQRGDYDLWPNSLRTATPNFNLTTAPLKHDAYTKFTLWSLGIVKTVREGIELEPVPEANQRISDFQDVSKVLYKMDFYVDIRAVDVHSQYVFIDHSRDEDGAELNQNSLILTMGECDSGPSKNEANQAFYNTRFLPICDIDNRTAAARERFRHFEPLGILASGIERVAYVDSKR